MKKQIEGQRVEMYSCAVGRGERKKTCFDDWQWAMRRAGSLHRAEPYGGGGVGQEQKEGGPRVHAGGRGGGNPTVREGYRLWPLPRGC